jgi:hypothetical protein
MIGQLVFFALAFVVAWWCGAANREDSRPGFFGLVQWLVLGVLALMGAAMLGRTEPLGLLVIAIAGVLAFPWAFARRWLIPYGHWRAAWVLVRSSAWTWHDDNTGGALVAAAWAAVRSGSASGAAFVERRCERSDCGAAHLLATGLVAAARGDLDAARRWIASLVEFEGTATPRMARRLAVQWCAADAATRGAWSRVAELDGDRDADATTAMLTTVARRLVGRAPIPDDAELERAWGHAPSRAKWRALVDRALQHEPADTPPPETRTTTGTAMDPDPHRAALVAHAQLATRERPLPAEVAAVAAAWDRALEHDPFLDRVRRRATDLGLAGDPIAALRERVERDLVDLVRTTGIALGDDTGRSRDVLDRVRRALHQRLLDELEVIADALKTRVVSRRALPIHEEWREYLAVRGEYQRIVAMTGPTAMRLAYAIVNPAVCALAVWLWNDRKNRVHAHQMFLWLLREAELAEDTEAIALHRRNVDCGR